MAAASKKPNRAPAECPVCGADVPSNARACPGCGADERTGWNDDDTRYDGLDLPGSAFEDGDAATRNTRRARRTPRVNGIALHWWLLATGLLILFLVGFVLRL
jgi:hypothetical protein